MHIDNLIYNFSQNNLIQYLRNKIPTFKPDNEDFSYLFDDEVFTKYESIEKIGDATINGDDLIIITSKTTDSLTEKTGKKNQYEIAKKILKEEVKDASIFVFYDDEGNFRFSFVNANYLGTKRNFSDFKRYTYFVNKDKQNNTFKNQVGNCGFSSLEEIINAFSVEPLNKLFYQEVSKAFYELIGGQINIASKKFDFKAVLSLPSTPLSNRKTYQEFAVRLIGRTIFCWFLKNKKSFNKLPLIPEEWLQSAQVELMSNFGNNYYHDYLEKLFFLILNKKLDERTPYDLPSGHETIPFLNGGLFEPHLDDFFPKDSKGIHKMSHNLIIPNEWFYKFFAVLEQFNFTIDENSVNDAEVSIDPEMLGTIFENLLAEIDPDTEKSARKATGSFYTPREIVDYMVEQSIIQYLKTKTTIEDEVALQNLFKEGGENVFNNEQTIEILEALNTVKILDPACGSGAFPMGALHKIITILHKIDPDASWWKEKQIKNIPNALARSYMQEKLDSSSADYIRKLGVIQNSIYGVDIQPIATEISKLRSFLSLIIDENIVDNAENRGIEPLPNLEFKFVTANSLIGLPNEKQQQGLFDNFEELQQLEQLRADYLQSSGENKNKIKEKFLGVQKKAFGSQNNLFANHQSRSYKLMSWNPFSDDASSWFEPKWMFGVEKFDIVIGNPPYVQIKKGIYSNIKFPFSEGKDKGKQNLYKLFVEESYNLLSDEGIASMIVQSSLLCDLSSTHTRELLLKKTEIYNIIEFPKKAEKSINQVFKTVLQGTCIYIIKKNKPKEDFNINISIQNNVSTIGDLVFERLQQKSIFELYPKTLYIPLIRKGDAEILYKIKSSSVVFKSLIYNLSQGDLNLTSSSSYFGENISPIKLYRGRNIQKFELISKTNEFVEIGFKDNIVNQNLKYTFIVLQEITGTTDKYRIHACLTNKTEKFLFGHTANKILLKDENNNQLVLAILNSKIIDWFFRKTSTNNHVMGYEIEQLPIIIPHDSIKQKITQIVDDIINLKSQKINVNQQILKLDLILFKLYGLDYDEILVIEPNIKLTREEFENYTIEK